MKTNDPGLAFHHLGLAVTRPDKAIQFLRLLGYSCDDVQPDPLQEVNIIWCTHPRMPDIEVLFPTGKPGPLDSYLKTQPEMLYHLCFSSQDVDASLRILRDAGHRIVCVSPPKPAVLFADKKVSFYMVAGFGLIEIIQA